MTDITPESIFQLASGFMAAKHLFASAAYLNQPLERTAHPAGFLQHLRHHRGWAAAHRQR
jgi:hypothetical protein